MAKFASPTRRCRTHLMATCTLALLAAPALCQTYPDRALQGDLTVVGGTVGIVRTPTKDTITVSTPQAIVNWNPETSNNPLPPGTINFLPNGREAVFQGGAIGQDFVVLNRILPSTTRAISLNGTVASQVVTGISPIGAPIYGRGGSVWFYSPGGILASSTAVFNVGSLILTTNDIDTTGGLFGPSGAIRFRGAANSTSAVTVQAGAQFNLPNAGSYLALVAPQVSMGGTATVNGSAAYLAAEQVDMTINGGLFGISFLTGTDVANALTHAGTTTGPTQTNGRIVMAAVPKNTAITMLVGGNVGYTPASTAAVQNGTVVLAAGYNLFQGEASLPAGGAGSSNIVISNGAFTSQVLGNSRTSLAVAPTGTLSFSSNATLSSPTAVSVTANAGSTITVGNNLILTAPAASINGAGTGGQTTVITNGGTLNVGNLLRISSATTQQQGTATGGTASLTLNGGTVTANALELLADAQANGGPGTGDNALGGTASLTINAGATAPSLTVGTALVSATGTAGTFQINPTAGGAATGGSALVTVNSGTMNSTAGTNVTASASGGAGDNLGGLARGGTARVALTGGRYDTPSLIVSADERQATAGPSGTAGGTAGAGVAAVDVSGGILAAGTSFGRGITISADAQKGFPNLGVVATGGALIAGTARLTASGTGSVTVTGATTQPVLVSASARNTTTGSGTTTSVQRGGAATVDAVGGGAISLQAVEIAARALVRDIALPNDSAGPSFGGTSTLSARDGGSVTIRAGGATLLNAFANGGSTAAPALGTGGTANVLALGGTISSATGLTADVRGFAGANGAGTGGTITVRSAAGAGAQPGSLTTGPVSLDASGQATAGDPNGVAGSITVTNTGQTMTFANVFARAGASNGAPSGSITITADNAPITTTANTTGIDLGTLGTLTLNAVGPNGSIVGSTGVFGFAQDIFVSHTGVAPAAATTLTGPSIQLFAGRDQIHSGAVTMRAAAVTLVGRRNLGGVDSSILATGGIGIGSGISSTSNAILFRTLDAGTGALFGYQGVSSTTPEITTPGSFTVSERAFAGTGNIDIRAGTGIDVADAGTSATGQVLLGSTGGDVRLATSGVALATRPNGIVLSAPGGTVRFANLFSRAAITASGLAIAGGDANAATNLLLNGTAGATAFGTVTAGGALAAAAGTTITGTSATATTGTLSLVGPTGVTVPTVVAGGAIGLVATNGTVTVATNLQPGGTATAAGQSIFLRSLGALNLGTLNATAGNLDVASVGALSVTTPQATGSVTLASTGGNVAFGSVAAGTSFTANAAGTATGTSATATSGPVSITGAAGITVPTIVSGGATTLSAANGAISVATNLQSAGLVIASGRSLFLRSTDALASGVLTATAGDVDVAAGTGLTVATAQASGDVILGAGTGLSPGSITAGRDIVLTASTLQATTLGAQRNLRITTTGLATATGAISATGNLNVNAGQTNLQVISGGNVSVVSGQGVLFTALTATGAATLISGDDTLGTSVLATGDVTVNAGRTINLGTLQSGGNATLYGNTASSGITVGATTVGGFLEARGATVNFGNVTAGTDAILSSYAGALTVGDVTAGDDIFLTINGSNANAATISPDSQTGQASTTQFALTSGNLRSTGQGSDTANSGPRTFQGAGPTGNVIRVRASGAVQTGSISTAGSAIIASDLATVATQAISGTAGIGVFVRGNMTLGNATTNGMFWLGDSSQYFGVVPAYTVINFAPLQTPTGGSATLGAVTAGLVRGSVLTNTTYTSIAANGDLLWSTGNSTTVGGSFTGGALSTVGTMTIRAGGALGFTTATAQGSALLIAGTGAVTGTSLTSTGSTVDVSGAAGVVIATVSTPSVASLGSANGDIRITTALNAGSVNAQGQSIFLRSPGAINATGLAAATGTIDVAAGGDLIVGQARARSNITLASATNLNAATVDAGYDPATQTSGYLADATLTGIIVTTGPSVRSGNLVTINATNTATINGSTGGRNQTAINSADIVIAAGATLGGIGSRLVLTNSGQGRTFIGDVAGTGGWRLDAAEIGRIVAHDVSILAPVIGGPASTAFNSARLPDVTVGSFTATGGQQLGGESTFLIQTAGKVRVTGTVALASLLGDTTFAIRGDEAIEILDGGRITMRDANGLAGILNLTSRNIIAASSTAYADFAAAPTLSAISDRAGKNDGAVDDGGYLQAGGIVATLLNSTLIIQNTGAATTAANRDYSGRRGYTVGAGGFTIVQGGTNPVRIAINGRQIGATTPLGAPTVGGFVTGLDVIPLIRIAPLDPQAGTIFQVPASGVLSAAQSAAAPRLFDTTSTVNGCAITGGNACRIVPNDPIRDILLGDFGEGSVGNLLPLALIQLKDYVTPGDEPLIDEPVTGAGNDDLWSVDDNKPKCDPAKEKCPA